MTECWVVTSGEWSDYTVHSVFEREQDATAYVEAYNRAAIRQRHLRNVERDYTPPNAWLKCVDPIETCPSCGKSYAEGSWELVVERYGFHPAGEIPHASVLEERRDPPEPVW